MFLDAVNPTPSPVAQPAFSQGKADPSASAASSIPKDKVTQLQAAANSMNVIVEIQKGNILVFKFIDEASGRTVQQIPPQGMLELASEIAAQAEKSQHGE